MAKIIFKPSQNISEVPFSTKILVAATKIKQEIRFGCASCRCGMCAVKVSGKLTAMKDNEKNLLNQMKLPLDGTVRLACQARVEDEDIVVDLSYQDQYDPETGPF